MTTTASKVKDAIIRWLPALAWMLLIFWFSSQPDLPRPASNILNLILRKSAHFGVYAMLALCCLYALQPRGAPHIATSTYCLALVMAILYAISDEYHQSWTPQRRPAATDVLIDTAGALTALTVWSRIGDSFLRFARYKWSAPDEPHLP